jgi:hypothetical protein
MKQPQKTRGWFGMVSTLALVVVAVTPATFGIPTADRVWVFLVAVFWMLLWTTGGLWS